MAKSQLLELEAAPPSELARAPGQAAALTKQVWSFIIILLVLVAIWEGYKLLGATTQDTVPGTGLSLPIRSDDKSMPHIWSIFGSLFQPAQRGNPDTLLTVLLRAAWFTWQEAATGFVMGSVTGLALGMVFGRSSLLERGLMPYVVASQTVPLLAIAPMVVIWSGRLNWPPSLAVAIISAYLTFFPVTINTLRGLRSPQPMAVELLRSYAASEGQILWKLRLPAALPYIFTALRISATASVIGAVVGELPSGISAGLGRALLTASYFYLSGPEKLYAAVLIAALVGIVFVAAVSLVERLFLPAERRLSD